MFWDGHLCLDVVPTASIYIIFRLKLSSGIYFPLLSSILTTINGTVKKTGETETHGQAFSQKYLQRREGTHCKLELVKGGMLKGLRSHLGISYE